MRSTSVDRRARRPHHERQRYNCNNFAGGIFSNHAVTNARGLVLQNVQVLPPASPLERPVPLRTCHATDPCHPRGRDYFRPTGFPQRSNPHSAAPLLIGISNPRGFLP